MQQTLSQLIAETLETLGISGAVPVIEVPADSINGDFSTNIALVQAKIVGKNPKELAQNIADALNKNLPEYLSSVTVAGPGFINFSLSQTYLRKELSTLLKNPKDYGKGNRLAKQKVMIEYTDPNILKPFHIGHLMSNSIGESLSRLIEWSGAEVKRANYFSDVGLNVAKALWGMRALKDEMPEENAPIIERTDFLGKSYVFGVAQAEANPEIDTEIREINKKVYAKSDQEWNDLYDLGKKWSLEHFELLYKKLGSEFDYFYPESDVAGDAVKIVTKALAEGIFEESQGAVIFPGEKYGLHTRVFINKEGLPTYEAKELALNTKKYKDYSFDQSIVITANEQDAYFSVVLEALKQINPNVAEKMLHLSHGMMTLTTGKMSSRKGNVITGESLIEDMFEKAQEKMSGRTATDKDIPEFISIAAIKYTILRQNIGKNIAFDPEKSLSFEGDSGPYLQYTAVRAKSILTKAVDLGIKENMEVAPNEINELERMIVQFPDVVVRAAQEYEPHHVATYLTKLAGQFNAWYAQQVIADVNDPLSSYRVGLTHAVVEVLGNGLWLLGMRVPPAM